MKMADPDLLELANTERMKALLPAAVLIVLVMVIGIVGNVHALLVYGFYYGKGNHRSYILWLSTFDLLGCCITIPLVISYYVNIYTFPTDINCKVYFFFVMLFVGCSIVILDIIAVDRYRRITSPLKKQLSHRSAQIACTITCLLVFMVSLKNLITIQASNIEIPSSNITGSVCDVNLLDDFSTVYGVILSIVLMLCFGSCIVLYTLILLSLTNKGKARSGRLCTSLYQSFAVSFCACTSCMSSTTNIKEDVTATSPKGIEVCSNEQPKRNQTCLNNEYNVRSNDTTDQEKEFTPPETSNNNDVTKSDDISELKMKESRVKNEIRQGVEKASKNNHLAKGRRVTIMFMIVSFWTCAVYIPTMVTLVLTSFGITQITNETLQGRRGILDLFLFLNHAINPIVYGFLDTRFRQKCKNMYLMRNCKNPQINVNH